jgi:SAM-dependent methyltransferase/DNA-binding transcriptional ArsR family regulator
MRRISFDVVGIAERTGLALSTIGLTLPAVPQPFYDAYMAPIGARALIAATRLGLIAALAEQPASPAELAGSLGLDEQSVELVLCALLNLGYTRRRRDGRFALRGTARRWLTPGTWDAVIGELAREGWDLIGHLDERLQGQPPVGWHERPEGDPLWERYQDAMAQLARQAAGPLAKAIPVRSPRRLLDLGGSHGLHAAAMCRRHPGLQATVIDLPPAVRFGRQVIAQEGMADRVTHLEGDIFHADLGSEWDLITAHALLHNFSPERCLKLLRLAHEALAPQGTFAILEIKRPARSRRGTRVGALSSLLFHTFGEGRCYQPQELRDMLRTTGFTHVKIRHLFQLPANFLVLAKR